MIGYGVCDAVGEGFCDDSSAENVYDSVAEYFDHLRPISVVLVALLPATSVALAMVLVWVTVPVRL